MKPTKSKSVITSTGDTFSVFFGRREVAVYTESPIQRYAGNPLLEALPPILSESQVSNALAYYPPFSESERKLPAEHRIHIVHTVLDLLVPMPEHNDLADRFSCLIRESYTARNPISAEYWETFRSRMDSEHSRHAPHLRVRSSARGMTILGISGAGKTTGVEAVLNLFPQVIQHSQYRGKPFTWTQIVWLKLQCPFDGSTRGLCLNFFQTVDALIGTNHYRSYAQGRRSTDELMPAMQRVASLHSIGVLVIDEIQHLDQSKSGGKERMLNFFTQLVNTIGVPVVFIGTPKAKSVLSQEFRQSRRGTGEGDFIWDRLENDENWKYFIESLWSFQYLRTVTPPSKELFDVIYDESQGIVDIAVKLFMLSQVRAVRSGQEVLTKEIIRSVAKDSFRTIQVAIDALRRGDVDALESIPDIKPIDYDLAVRRITNASRMANLAAQHQSHLSSQSKATEAALHAPETSGDSLAASNDSAAAPGVSASLVAIVEQARKTNASPHDALKAHGLVRDCAEYLA